MRNRIFTNAIRTLLGMVAVAAVVAFANPAAAGPLGYDLIGTTHYTGGCGAGTLTTGICGSPDTGWLQITNNGASSFTGDASLSGTAPGQTINLTISGTLAPGQSWVFNAGPESSNQGGWNKVPGSNDNGLLFSMNGTLDGGSFVNSIYDKDIHSGVFRTNPFGVSLDNYVLQGGDPLGRDTGDGFEESQAIGHFEWAASPAVPEPATLTLVSIGILGAVYRRRKT
jgi:hypothetical protein